MVGPGGSFNDLPPLRIIAPSLVWRLISLNLITGGMNQDFISLGVVAANREWNDMINFSVVVITKDLVNI